MFGWFREAGKSTIIRKRLFQKGNILWACRNTFSLQGMTLLNWQPSLDEKFVNNDIPALSGIFVPGTVFRKQSMQANIPGFGFPAIFHIAAPPVMWRLCDFGTLELMFCSRSLQRSQ